MSYKFNPFTGTLDEIGADGAATTPGGSDGQIQFNDGGGFGGITGSSVDATGSITLSLAGAASTPPVSFTGSWFTGGTSTTTKPQLLIEPTGTTSTAWSTDGTGLGVNAASGFTGNLLDLQVNGTSVTRVLSDGKLLAGDGNGSTVAGFRFASQPNIGMFLQTQNIGAGSNVLSFRDNSFSVFLASGSSILRLSSNFGFGWASGTANATNPDLKLYRDAANTLAQRNDTYAQKINIYDTYTSDTDYHRVTIATARATLSSVSGASVTATGLIPAGAVVMGVTSKVTTALGTTNSTTGYKIGTVADDDRWGNITGTAAGTTSDNRDWTAGTIECFPAATDVIVTAVGGNFDATGVIYLSVQYMAGEAD